MSDYFFYDMNKKMADLANKQQLAEDAQAAPAKPAPNRLMEAAADYSAKKAAAGKDIGKPGKNFSKIAAGAAKRYGSEEAGKRVAGAVLNKLRHPTEESIDQAQLKPWKATMKEGGKPDFLDLDKDGNRKEPMRSAARSAKKGLREVDATPQNVDDWTPPAKPATKASAAKPPVVPKPGPKKPAMYPPQAIDDPVKEAAKYRAPKYKDKLYTQEPLDHTFGPDMDAAYDNDYPDDYAGRKSPMDSGRGDPLTRGFRMSADKSINTHGKRKGLPSRDQISSLKGSIKAAHGTHAEPNLPEDGVPMTPKQKKFAALAKPFDKISFADKIVGAKKEVDEMLGDVAANAMKSAVGKMRGRNRDMDESWIDDEPTRRRSSSGGEIDTSKPGVTRHTAVKGNYSGARHDVGVDDEPSGAVGRRKVGAGQGKKIGAKINRGTSKLMTDEDMFEPQDQGEYDQEGQMAKDDIKTVVRHAQALEKILGDNDNLPEWVQAKLAKIEGMMTAVDDYMQNQKSSDIETESTGSFSSGATNPSDPTPAEWAELKRKAAAGDTRAQEYVRWGMRRTSNKKYEPGTGNQTGNVAARTRSDLSPSAAGAGQGNRGVPDNKDSNEMDEESTNKRDSRAERAGRKVAKDIEYDEKKKDGIHGKRRGSEDNRAEKAGKKVTKDIEYDEKKDKKKKEVDETTTSGSVATSSAAPKSGGGHNYGKGIYDSLNRQLENMISESMTVNMTMNNDEHGGPKQSLTVTATDDDAVMLAGLLKMAGMGHGDEHIHAMTGDDSDMDALHNIDHMHGDEPCADCGSSPCGCEDEMMDEAYGDTDASENNPDWPTDEEGTEDAMMYSGGLNGPKSTGQTTIPVIAGQKDRMGYNGLDEELGRMLKIAGIAGH